MFTDQATFAGTGAGTANAQTATLPNVSSYADLLGVVVKYIPGTTNTGDTVLTINSIGSAPHFRKPSSTGQVALTGGELIAGIPVAFVYDGTYFNLLGAALTTPAGQWPNALSGLGLAYDSATVLDVAAGACADSTNTFFINLGTFTKSTAGSWAAGSGSNGMGTALTIAVSTWYHVFAIINAGVADVYFDTSVLAVNKPVGTTAFRRIGSFKTDSSAHILPFFQNGETFLWSTMPALDYNANNPGTSAASVTLNGVPPGVRVGALLNATIADINHSGVGWLLSSPDVADTAPSYTASPLGTLTENFSVTTVIGAQATVWTSASQTIRSRVSASDSGVTLRLQVIGWLDLRGKT